ncbi:unnamed protein product [Lactuca virosa]|uniref:3'-5' exonuclease domain-containing protein n=1 Tax=Lactuca virosa TaxID=75947 RepID=A0AAU9P6D9_9ASTR|nr:unnamed protein product [Lactuca virosa]
MTSMSIFDHKVPDDDHDYYDVTFFEDTILTLVTAKPSYVDFWINDIERIHRRRLHSLVVGLFIEWRPNRRNNVNPVATLQLCVGHRCLIFQIIHSPTTPLLRDFLLNPSYTFVGAGIEDDVKKLKDGYNLDVGRTMDLRALVTEKYNRPDLGNVGLKGLTRIVLGKELIKQKIVSKSRWDNRRLSPAQVEYACIDAFLSFEIGRILISGNTN